MVVWTTWALPALAPAAEAARAQPAISLADYALGPGDIIRVSIFQNPDLTTEARVSESGTISFPLVGQVAVGGVSLMEAETRIARRLKEGKFLVDPQVTVALVQIRGNQVAALGQFARPGRYPLETTQMRLSDLIATAGGIAPSGSDIVIFTGQRDGKTVRREIDVGRMFSSNHPEDDFVLRNGDVLFVDRYPLFYVYGEVQRPGSYRVERDMNVMQALATGGGLTQRGTQRGIRIKRRDAEGKHTDVRVELTDPVLPGDVLYVSEGIF